MKALKYIGLAIAIMAINQIFALTPAFGAFIYYLLIGVALIIGLSYHPKLKFNPFLLWFLFASVASLFVNAIPDFFKAPLRLATFTAVVALVGPLIYTIGLTNMRQYTFKALNSMIFILSTLSILLYIIGVSLGPNTGGFSGFFNHSMLMGPLAGIALIVGLYRYYSIKNPEFKTRRSPLYNWFLIVLLVVLFLVLLLSSSRAALISTLTGIIFFFYKPLHTGNYIIVPFWVKIKRHPSSAFLSIIKIDDK